MENVALEAAVCGGTTHPGTPLRACREHCFPIQSSGRGLIEVNAEFGLLTENEAREALEPGEDSNAYGFTLRYRGQTLYPRFLFEPSPAGARLMRVRPGMKDLKKIADEYGWSGHDVVLWMTSPTTWFTDQRQPVDHLDEHSRTLAAFEDQAGAQW